jgi:hypothetical protein
LEPLEDRVVLTITLIGSEAMATDPAGNIYITGTLGNSDTSGVDGWADFDPGPGQTWVNRAGEFDGFLAKYGADRSLKWVVRLDGPQRQVLTDVAVDVDGSAFVVGTTTGISTFWNGDGSYQTIDSPERATVVAKVSPDGVAQWVDTFKWTGGRGQVNYNATGSIALDSVGHVYADGNVNFGATGDFFGQPVTNSGFVLKLHSTNPCLLLLTPKSPFF